jgi:hypothetical protein
MYCVCCNLPYLFHVTETGFHISQLRYRYISGVLEEYIYIYTYIHTHTQTHILAIHAKSTVAKKIITIKS